MSSPRTPSLGYRMITTASLFQALVAFPIMLITGGDLFYVLVYNSYSSYDTYVFCMSTFICLMAAAILFVVLIQRQGGISKTTSLYFEAVKSACATSVWLWLLMDSIFKVHLQDKYYNPELRKRARIVRTSISVVCLLTLFYPTLVFTFVNRRRGDGLVEEEEERDAGAVPGENTPLLR